MAEEFPIENAQARSKFFIIRVPNEKRGQVYRFLKEHNPCKFPEKGRQIALRPEAAEKLIQPAAPRDRALQPPIDTLLLFQRPMIDSGQAPAIVLRDIFGGRQRAETAAVYGNLLRGYALMERRPITRDQIDRYWFLRGLEYMADMGASYWKLHILCTTPGAGAQLLESTEDFIIQQTSDVTDGGLVLIALRALYEVIPFYYIKGQYRFTTFAAYATEPPDVVAAWNAASAVRRADNATHVDTESIEFKRLLDLVAHGLESEDDRANGYWMTKVMLKP